MTYLRQRMFAVAAAIVVAGCITRGGPKLLHAFTASPDLEPLLTSPRGDIRCVVVGATPADGRPADGYVIGAAATGQLTGSPVQIGGSRAENMWSLVRRSRDGSSGFSSKTDATLTYWVQQLARLTGIRFICNMPRPALSAPWQRTDANEQVGRAPAPGTRRPVLWASVNHRRRVHGHRTRDRR
jgi:hypothetical protein